MRHSITQPDEETRTGVCSQCGPGTDIYKNTGYKDAFYWRCAEAARVYALARVKKNPDVGREAYFLRKFGITIAQYDAMLAEQGGVCARCHQPPGEGRIKRLAVDHCHTTGVIRGLLCGPCTYLGRLEANRDSLITDLDYIDKGVVARPILEKLGPA